MTEQELKKYWYAAYAAALSMLRHPETVTPKEISSGVTACGSGVFNRLFCLAVWQEVQLQKAGKPSIPPEQYKNAVADVWMIFKNYGDGDGSESYWDRLVEELCRVMKQYQRCPLIINLVIHVTLEAIEDIQQKKQAMSKKSKEKKMRKENARICEETMQETYIICVSPDWVRDTQVFDTDSLPEGIDPDTVDIYDETYDPLWYDAREPLFVRTVQAHDEEEASRIVADAKKYPVKCLYAFRP